MGREVALAAPGRLTQGLTPVVGLIVLWPLINRVARRFCGPEDPPWGVPIHTQPNGKITTTNDPLVKTITPARSVDPH